MDVLSVLYVDNDEKYGKSISQVLLNTGISLTIVSGADEAIKILPESNFNIAIIEIDMPGADGFKVLDFIMDNRLPPKVIMITDTSEQALASGIRGAQGTIDKPFDLKNLMDAMTKAMMKGKVYLPKRP